MSDEFALGDARRQRATEWAGLGVAERDRVVAVILTGMSPSEARRAIARIRADGRAAADETVRRYHTDTADRMDRLLRQTLAARWEAAERAVVEAIDPDRLPPLETEEEVLAFAEFVVRAAEPTQCGCEKVPEHISNEFMTANFSNKSLKISYMAGATGARVGHVVSATGAAAERPVWLRTNS
jgi:hypothetical protein